jgi:acetoacetyl-CoA reductase
MCGVNLAIYIGKLYIIMDVNSEKTVIVAGISGGLASAVVEQLKDDYSIVGLGRNVANEDKNGISYKKIDLTDLASLKKLAAELEESREIYGVINCAGSVVNGPLWKLSQEDFNNCIQDNLFTCFSLMSAFGPTMRSLNSGRFIFLSSVVARVGAFGASHYAAAKGGIEALTRSAATEFASHGITVNAISPGYMDSGIISAVPAEKISEIVNQIPQKRLGPSRQVGAMCHFLLGEDASYITAQVLGINGGL